MPLALLDAALVLAVLDAEPEAVHLRCRTELCDGKCHHFGLAQFAPIWARSLRGG